MAKSKKPAGEKASPGLVLVLPINSCIPDPANLNGHSRESIEKIKGSLAAFGQVSPIVIDQKDVIRKGNGTWQAAKELGWLTIKAVRTDLEGVQAVAYSIADNQTARFSNLKVDEAVPVLAALRDEDHGLFLATGFDDDSLQVLIDQAEADHGQALDNPSSGQAGEDSGREAGFSQVQAHDGQADDGFVPFKFGDHQGRVGKEVYESFKEAFRSVQAESGEPMIDDVLRVWLKI